MSRAFVKEQDGDLSPEELPDRPVSPHRNLVTPEGLAQLRDLLVRTRKELAELRLQDGEGAEVSLENRTVQAQLARDLRYYEARLQSAELQDQKTVPGNSVAFGAWLLLVDEDDTEYRYRIVGEDEADPQQGLISYRSPLAMAAMDAEVGDLVRWPRPTGTLELELVALSYDGPAEE